MVRVSNAKLHPPHKERDDSNLRRHRSCWWWGHWHCDLERTELELLAIQKPQDHRCSFRTHRTIVLYIFESIGRLSLPFWKHWTFAPYHSKNLRPLLLSVLTLKSHRSLQFWKHRTLIPFRFWKHRTPDPYHSESTEPWLLNFLNSQNTQSQPSLQSPTTRTWTRF